MIELEQVIALGDANRFGNFCIRGTGADPGFEKGGAHRSRAAKIGKLMILMTCFINVRLSV